MNKLQVFKSGLFEVAAKIEGEQILFDAEQIAKSLGFTTVARSGNTTVRWSRVNSYLPENFPKLAKGDFIPEALVYKLAFKASNEVAQDFQDWLAIEVIPTIRKNGSYQIEQQPNNTKLLLQTALKHEEEIEGIKSDVNYLKETMRIDGNQEHEIGENARRKVVKALGGKGAPAYKELSRKAFSEFWRDFKGHFVVPRYGELPKKKFEDGLRFIELWQPSTSLRIDIESANKQQVMEEVF